MINKDYINPRFILLLSFIAIVAISRVFLAGKDVLLANFTPIGAMALFGGAYFQQNSKAFLFPLLSLLISDALLSFFNANYSLFYSGFYWVYGAFILMVLVGRLLRKKLSITNFFLSSILVVAIHWIVTDFGVWMSGTMYPKTLAGFWTCLVAAIPFERNFLFGTLIYGTLMFGIFEWVKLKNPQFQLKEAQK